MLFIIQNLDSLNDNYIVVFNNIENCLDRFLDSYANKFKYFLNLKSNFKKFHNLITLISNSGENV